MRPDTVLWRSADGVAHTAPDPALNPLVPGFVDIIDQTLLPGEFKRILLSEPRTVYDAIRRLAVRGAPAIGCAAIDCVRYMKPPHSAMHGRPLCTAARRESTSGFSTTSTPWLLMVAS